MRIESVPCSSCNESVPTNVPIAAKAQELVKSEGKAAVRLIENAPRPPAPDGTGRAVDVLA